MKSGVVVARAQILLLASAAPRLAPAPDLVCRSPLVVVPRFAEVKVALGRLSTFGAVALLSAHAVEVLVGTLLSLGRDTRALAHVRILAVAGATADALAAHGLLADLVGSGGGQELAAAAIDADLAGPFLIFGARDGRTELADRLSAAGRRVERVDAYDALLDDAVVAEVTAAHAQHPFAALGIGSPKIAAAWHAAVKSWPPLVGALGETTAAALRALGCAQPLVASHPSLEALVAELRAALAGEGTAPLAVRDQIE